MNIYHELDKVIDYIEDNLENNIGYEKIARILGVKNSEDKQLKKGIKKFPKIIFKEEVTDSSDLTYNIISLDEFTLYGVGIKTTSDAIKGDASRFFDECINKFNKHPDYDMVTYEDRYNSDNFEYRFQSFSDLLPFLCSIYFF